jgi:MoaA/NifB/PqqE/SkfB family radical SAM enzyme
MGYFDHSQYVELTMHFRCNLKCEHCMIEGTMDWLTPESMEEFQQVLDHNSASGQWKGLILTGSEVTLRKDLPDLSRRARQHGFEHVRIQTHGMRLANRDYCHELVDAGVDEFFVSVTAADAATHDSITEVPGSFERTIRGLENLDAFSNIVTLTNTVITKRCYQQLPDVVKRLSHLRSLVQMDFWNFWPMKEVDEKDLIVPHAEVLPFLRQAIALARKYGRSVEVKNFPECLLGEDGDALRNDQPKLLTDPKFWPEFHRNGFKQCVHSDHCGSKQCLGLNTAYIRKFGWHEELLKPLPPASPQAQEK